MRREGFARCGRVRNARLSVCGGVPYPRVLLHPPPPYRAGEESRLERVRSTCCYLPTFLASCCVVMRGFARVCSPPPTSPEEANKPPPSQFCWRAGFQKRCRAGVGPLFGICACVVLSCFQHAAVKIPLPSSSLPFNSIWPRRIKDSGRSIPDCRVRLEFSKGSLRAYCRCAS